MQTAERVSQNDISDNYVYQRSLLAYHEAAKLVHGDVLEIGTGSGYGIDIIAPWAAKFVTLDKHNKAGCTAEEAQVISKHRESDEIIRQAQDDSMRDISLAEARIGMTTKISVLRVQATVPPLPFPDASFDTVVSFQVIEHVRRDKELVAEIYRVLRPGGRLIISTPNIKMSLTRNPWHVREYTVEEFAQLLEDKFHNVERLGVFGREKVMEYYENNRRSVAGVAKWDILGMRNWLPRRIMQVPYDILNRINRRRLLAADRELTAGITMDDYYLAPATDKCFDLFYIACACPHRAII